MMRHLFRLLYPPKCIFCGTVVENDRFAVCDTCKEKIPYNLHACKICGTPLDTVYGPDICTRCAKHPPRFSRAYVPFIYKDSVRTAILRFKFGGRRASAVTMAAYIFMKMRALGAERPDIITYVPMHFLRLGKRGFNQSALLAKALGEIMSVPVKPLLKRIKHTVPQSKKSRRERQNAIKGVYALRENAEFENANILLTDDVITTGTTLSVCAGILKKNGARQVEIATVAATSHV